MVALTAFKESYLASDTLDGKTFEDFDSRKMRYQIFWAFYENNAYRDVHNWASLFRHDFGLYRYIRNIYNPAYRIGEFWKAHLLAGQLDSEAGDGKDKFSALPIVTEYENLRPAIAQIWKWSNWFVKKDVLALWGAVLGDAFIRINDDPFKQRVYMTLVHPGTVKSVEKDEWGNIKSYVIEQLVDSPHDLKKKQVYSEVAYRSGENVVYETFIDGKPLKNTYDAESGEFRSWWVLPYGFIPLVQVLHNDVGLDYGWSEYHAGISKIREVDDVASKLNDQIRKMVDSPWLFAGVADPKIKKNGTDLALAEQSQAGSTENPESGREKIPVIYGPMGAEAKALVADLDISATGEQINALLKELERDYPELNVDLKNAGGDISGRALRAHREPVTDKVNQRRVGYDDAIVRAQQMAVSIAGWREYEGFEGFNLESYAAGLLEHSIGERPVFAKDELDDIEIKKAFWDLVKIATTSGQSLPLFLKSEGWSDKDINEVVNSPEYQARLAGLEAAKSLSETMPTNPDRFKKKIDEQGEPVDTEKAVDDKKTDKKIAKKTEK